MARKGPKDGDIPTTASDLGSGGKGAEGKSLSSTMGRYSQRGSKMQRIAGERLMKEYPVTRDELLGLGTASALSSAALSYGFTQINRAYDISKDLELTQGLPPQLIGRWHAKQEDAELYGMIFIAVGVILFVVGGAKVLSILKSTSHPK